MVRTWTWAIGPLSVLFAGHAAAQDYDYHWEGSSDIQYGTRADGYKLESALKQGDLGGALAATRATATSTSRASGAWAVSGSGYNLGITGKLDATGEVSVDGVLHPSEVNIQSRSYWQDGVQILAEGEIPFFSLKLNWKVRGDFSHVLRTGLSGGRVTAGIYVRGLGDDDFTLAATYHRDNDTDDPPAGDPQVSGLATWTIPLGGDAKGSFSGEVLLDGYARNGSLKIGFGNTFSLDSITFPDGSTPESHGYTIVFDSGLPSPNLNSTFAAADFDRSLAVDVDDLATWAEGFGDIATHAMGDADGDGDADGADFLTWQRELSGGDINAVPEPASVIGVATAAIAFLGAKGRVSKKRC